MNQLVLPSPEQLARLKRWRISTFWVMLIGYIGYYMVRKNLSAALPLLEDWYGFTNSELGLIGLYSEIAYAVGKVINGPWGDKVGGRKVFLLGMIGAIFFNLLFAYGESLIFFIVVWCLCRYFLSMGWGGIVKTIGAWYERERHGTVMGFISINFQFGGVIATLFAGWLVALGFGWRSLFFAPALVVTVIWVWSWLASREKPSDVVPNVKFGFNASARDERKSVEELEAEDEDRGVIENLKMLLKQPIFRHLLIFSLLTTVLRGVFFMWTPKFFKDIGMASEMAILKSALFPFLGALGTILLGWYTDRYAPRGNRAGIMWKWLACLTVCMGMIAVFSKSGLAYETPIVILTGLAGFFLLGPYSMTSGALTLDIAGHKAASSCSGMLDGIGYFGSAVGLWAAGKISDEAGWPVVFGVLSVICVISTFSAFMMGRAFDRLAAEKA